MLRRFLPLPLFLAFLGVSLALPGQTMAELGFQSFDAAMTNGDGSSDTQAGSHPFQLTTSFSVKTAVNAFEEVLPGADIKDVRVDLPPGLIGSATAVPPCGQELFATVRPETEGKDNSTPSCGNASVVGIAAIFTHPTFADYVPIYSLIPPHGMPAEFGFNVQGTPVVLVPSLLSSSDYGLRVESINTSQALHIYASTVTFWGVPADPRHDEVRGSCLNQGLGISTGDTCPADVAPKPLLTLPTACSGPLRTTIHADSWQEPGLPPELWPSDEVLSHDEHGDPVGIDGCNQLDFSPSLAVNPDTTTADSPTGLEVGLRLPQNENPEGLAEADVRKVAMTLPAGVSVSPSAADGLEACTEELIGLRSPSPAQCPDASKVGSVKIESPLLEHPLEGWVYIAQQNSNPFGTLLALYLVAEGSGVRIKLAGGIEANPSTGQLTTRFEERPAQQLSFPQLPFSELKLKLFGGPRAALVTPQSCGTYVATSQLTSWSSETQTPVSISSSPPFPITSGCTGQFNPSLTAGTTNNQAGSFSPFITTFSRSDQDQNLNEVTVEPPPGLLGMLSTVPLCGEPQAQLGTCSASSQIGHVTVSAGAGPDPVFLPQAGRLEDPVYLTGPYNGAPFGLSIVEHAEAGPFNLGTVIVRAAIGVDPHTAQVVIKSQPLPQILQGIPTEVRSVTVTVDRPGFIFNPTSCNPLTVTGTAVSTQGSSAVLSSRYQAAGCQALAFKPTFAVSTQGRTSKTGGASLHVKVTSGAGQANIAQVKVDLPKQLPARLTTLQKACPGGVFAANPASCPAASLVGTATAHTPVLSSPLAGPAYLVSHGGAAFPDLVIVLQGEGVTFDLDGLTGIKHGITSSTFRSIPDAPVSTFELTLPAGPRSVLGGNLPAKAKGSLCGQNLTAPTALTGQDGTTIKQNTRITITGCSKHRRAPHRRGMLR
jgi:hypothetical protein